MRRRESCSRTQSLRGGRRRAQRIFGLTYSRAGTNLEYEISSKMPSDPPTIAIRNRFVADHRSLEEMCTRLLVAVEANEGPAAAALWNELSGLLTKGPRTNKSNGQTFRGRGRTT